MCIYNLGTNGWSAPKRWPIDDGQLTANALASGDLNGDKLTDLVLLGENNIYFLAQNRRPHAGASRKKSPSPATVKAVQVLDIDGDGRDDLLLVNWDSPNPFRFRLQNADGELGPEIYFTLPADPRLHGGRSGGQPQDGSRDHRAKLRARAPFRTSCKSRPSRFPAISNKGSFKSCR